MKRIVFAIALFIGAALPCLSAADGTLSFVSQSGDYVGVGATVSHQFTDADVNFYLYGQRLLVQSQVTPSWTLHLNANSTRLGLGPGCFERAQSLISNVRPHFDFNFGSISCYASSARFKVLELSSSGNTVTSLALDFVQHCSNGGSALQGKLRYNSIVPLDTPPLALVFMTTGVLSFVSDAGDYIGQGETNSYPLNNSNFTSSSHDDGNSGTTMNYSPRLPIGTWWRLNFAAPSGTVMAAGEYLNARRYPFQPAGLPGLDFSGSGRGCNQLSGEFTIAQLERERIDGLPQRIDSVFEQHCEHAVPALRGSVDFTTIYTNGELVDDVLFLDGLESAANTRWPLAWSCPLN